MRETETLDDALAGLAPLPEHTCPDVDKMLRTLQSEGCDTSTAADDAASMSRQVEEADATKALCDASTALEHAERAIEEAATALDHERDVAAALRAGCDERESIARAAIQGCAERDDRIQTLEAEVGEREALIQSYQTFQERSEALISNLTEIVELQRHKQGVSQKVINHLSEKIRKPWWQKLADTGKRIWWERKARGRAKTIQRLREERNVLNTRNTDLFDALLTADGVLMEQEWEDGPLGEKWCPSCHVTDHEGIFRRPPKHEAGCRVGQACEVIRWAIRNEAREQGMDAQNVRNGRREFQV